MTAPNVPPDERTVAVPPEDGGGREFCTYDPVTGAKTDAQLWAGFLGDDLTLPTWDAGQDDPPPIGSASEDEGEGADDGA